MKKQDQFAEISGKIDTMMLDRLCTNVLKRNQLILGRLRHGVPSWSRCRGILKKSSNDRRKTWALAGGMFLAGVGLRMGSAAIVNTNNNSNNTTSNHDKNSNETESNKDNLLNGNKNEIESSRKRLMASISVPNHYSIVWCWLYFKRFIFLLFNFSPMVMVAPLAYFDPLRWKDYWLNMIRISFGNGGSTFIKLAQWISMREDIFPLEICQALAGLRIQAPIHSFEETCRVIEESFGRKIDEIFERFYIEPVASGSIAQVHRAQICVDLDVDSSMNDDNDDERLFSYLWQKCKDSIMSKISSGINIMKNSSNERNRKGMKNRKLIDVAVKVRHPNILQDMAIDINILYTLSNIVSSIPGFGGLKVPIYQPKFAQYLESQIDLCYEAQSLEIFNQNFQNSKNKVSYLYDSSDNVNDNINDNKNSVDKNKSKDNYYHIWRYKRESKENKNKKSVNDNDVIFPLPIKGLISRAVLCETWEYGIPLCDLDLTKLTMNHRYKLAKQCYDIFMKMLLRDNFVHGDCHSGNILIKGENISGPLVFLDAGLTASLSNVGNDKFGMLMGHIVTGNTNDAAEMFSQWCMLDDSNESQKRKHRFVNGLSNTIDKHLEWPYGEKKKGIPFINVGNLLRDVLLLTQKEEIVLESQFSAVIASLGVIEGLIKHLYPKADFLSWGVPYLVTHKKMNAIRYLLQYVT